MIYNVIDRKRKKKENPYLTFSSPHIFGLTVGSPGWDGTIEISTDAKSWSTYSGQNTVAVSEGGQYKLYARGKGNTVITGPNNIGASFWSFGGNVAPTISCFGNIETLLDYELCEKGTHPEMGEGCFAGMFCLGGRSMIRPPELPAKQLAAGCYMLMFRDCISLKVLPKLPATELPDACYTGMFRGCTSIKVSSEENAEYTVPYQLPWSAHIGSIGKNSVAQMFYETGGVFTDAPIPNTTYWLHKDNSVV